MGKEKPISFTAAMIKACREGRKTVTRRVIKIENPGFYRDATLLTDGAYRFNGYGTADFKFLKPRYNVGDLLWVKETWAYYPDENHVIYKAREGIELEQQGIDLRGCWKSSRFMFKKFARTWLEVVSVRPERVQDITAEDTIREGIEISTAHGEPAYYLYDERLHYTPDPRESFQTLWDSVNDKRGYSWESNPFVWRIEFKKN